MTSGERPDEIFISTANVDPNATWVDGTATPTMVLNLDSSEDVVDPTTTFDVDDPESYTYSTSMTVYDSKGNSHKLTLFFSKTDATATGEEWSVHARLDNGDSGEIGSLMFDLNGKLVEPDPVPTPPDSTLTIPATLAASWESDLSGATLGDLDFSIAFAGTTNF